jgi:large subunit ribosomal protein L29
MKDNENKSMSEQELIDAISSETENLQRLKFAHAVSAIENPMRIRASRRYIAQMMTELNARKKTK